MVLAVWRSSGVEFASGKKYGGIAHAEARSRGEEKAETFDHGFPDPTENIIAAGSGVIRL